jgi:hypothetical protein
VGPNCQRGRGRAELGRLGRGEGGESAGARRGLGQIRPSRGGFSFSFSDFYFFSFPFLLLFLFISFFL